MRVMRVTIRVMRVRFRSSLLSRYVNLPPFHRTLLRLHARKLISIAINMRITVT